MKKEMTINIGPGQKTGFAVPDFANSIANIELNRINPVMKARNLEVYRDFSVSNFKFYFLNVIFTNIFILDFNALNRVISEEILNKAF